MELTIKTANGGFLCFSKGPRKEPYREVKELL